MAPSLRAEPPDADSNYLYQKRLATDRLKRVYDDPAISAGDREEAEREELAKLTQLMRSVLKLPGFPETPSSAADPNLQSLISDAVPSCADGLNYEFAGARDMPEKLFVTHMNWIRPGLSTATLLGQMACDSAGRTIYGTIKGFSMDRFDSVQAYIVLAAPDFGPYPPNEVDVVARKGDQLYMFAWPVDATSLIVDACNKKFAATPGQAKKQEVAFSNLVSCYGRSFERNPNHPTFEHLRPTIAAILRRISP